MKGSERLGVTKGFDVDLRIKHLQLQGSCKYVQPLLIKFLIDRLDVSREYHAYELVQARGAMWVCLLSIKACTARRFRMKTPVAPSPHGETNQDIQQNPIGGATVAVLENRTGQHWPSPQHRPDPPNEQRGPYCNRRDGLHHHRMVVLMALDRGLTEDTWAKVDVCV